MTTVRTTGLEGLRFAATEAAALLRAQEQAWQAELQAAPNPFVGVQRYTSDEARARRAAALADYFAARDALANCRHKRAEAAA